MKSNINKNEIKHIFIYMNNTSYNELHVRRINRHIRRHRTR
jgi:hypothetical protein